jgi:hypothetical protein
MLVLLILPKAWPRRVPECTSFTRGVVTSKCPIGRNVVQEVLQCALYFPEDGALETEGATLAGQLCLDCHAVADTRHLPWIVGLRCAV